MSKSICLLIVALGLAFLSDASSQTPDYFANIQDSLTLLSSRPKGDTAKIAALRSFLKLKDVRRDCTEQWLERVKSFDESNYDYLTPNAPGAKQGDLESWLIYHYFVDHANNCKESYMKLVASYDESADDLSNALRDFVGSLATFRSNPRFEYFTSHSVDRMRKSKSGMIELETETIHKLLVESTRGTDDEKLIDKEQRSKASVRQAIDKYIVSPCKSFVSKSEQFFDLVERDLATISPPNHHYYNLLVTNQFNGVFERFAGCRFLIAEQSRYADQVLAVSDGTSGEESPKEKKKKWFKRLLNTDWVPPPYV